MQNSHSTRVTHDGASLSCHSLRLEAQAAGSDLVSMHLAPSAVEMAASTTHRNTNLSARAPNAERETCNMPQARQGKSYKLPQHAHTHTLTHTQREARAASSPVSNFHSVSKKPSRAHEAATRSRSLSLSLSRSLSLFAFALN